MHLRGLLRKLSLRSFGCRSCFPLQPFYMLGGCFGSLFGGGEREEASAQVAWADVGFLMKWREGDGCRPSSDCKADPSSCTN